MRILLYLRLPFYASIRFAKFANYNWTRKRALRILTFACFSICVSKLEISVVVNKHKIFASTKRNRWRQSVSREYFEPCLEDRHGISTVSWESKICRYTRAVFSKYKAKFICLFPLYPSFKKNIYRAISSQKKLLQLTSRAFQNTIIKYFFIEYFSSYEAWNNLLILHKP